MRGWRWAARRASTAGRKPGSPDWVESWPVLPTLPPDLPCQPDPPCLPCLPRLPVLVAAPFDLLQRVGDELCVVFLREIALDDLRGNLHRQFDGFGSNLLNRPGRFELNLSLGGTGNAFRFCSDRKSVV